MSRRAYEIGGRLGLALVALVAVGVLVRKRDPSPSASPSASASASAALERPSRAPAPRAPGVFARLSDGVGRATVDAPNLAKVDTELDYWRRMHSPWVRASGDLARAVQQVSLVRSGGRPGRQGLGGGGAWVPDPKVWNMNEGSFDQREVLFAPAPASYRFRGLDIPAGARFETGLAIVGPSLGGAEFELAARVDGKRQVLATQRIDGDKNGTYQPLTVDLGKLAGKRIELELTTRALVPAAGAPAAVWGTPTIFAPNASELPYNVLFIVVDALRGDAIAAFHDAETDAKMARADPPPLDAWLPKMPEVAPNLSRIAERGVVFTRASSAATWTRPGTLAMLTGVPSSHLGLSPLPLVPAKPDVRRLYASRPPFLPLLIRSHGVSTEAFVNNFYMTGYAGVGVDFGFESLTDHRYGTKDTQAILDDAKAALERDKSRRFFMFVNFDSPHVPYKPPPSALAAIPKPPSAPADKLVRAYLAEIHKDDAAIGELIARLDELGLADQTLVVVTADHGETLSVEHDAVPDGVDGGPQIGGRFHHLSSLYDETAHIPILMVLPKALPAGTKLGDPVSVMDIVPTILELERLPSPSSVEGLSLMPLIGGHHAPERAILVEGRGAHSIRVGRWRLLLRDPEYKRVHTKGRHIDRSVELYDLETDPGERVEVSKQHPDVVARLRALDASGRRADADAAPSVLHLRFAGAGQRHHVRGRITASSPAKFETTPFGIPPELVRALPDGIGLEFDIPPDAVVGLDLVTRPADADLSFDLRLDGKALPKQDVYAGTLGLAAPELVAGLRGDTGRRLAAAEGVPFIDPDHDLGLFIARDSAEGEIEIDAGDAAKKEAMGLMRAWGYLR
jgi:arylsulfatase A-like enzyme